MKLLVQEEPALYRVLVEPIRPATHQFEGDTPIFRLGDIARTSSGGTPRRDRPEFYGGSIPWVKSGELRDGVVMATEESITEEAVQGSSAKVFPKGTVCVALYGATVGRVGVLGIDAATNQAVCGIFPDDGLLAAYLRYFLFARRQLLIDSGKGGAQPNISQQIVRDLQVPLPSVTRQREIVDQLDEQLSRLDASVAALHRVQANLKRYRASVLKSACEGRLVPTEAELARQAGRDFETGEQLLQGILAERLDLLSNKRKKKELSAPAVEGLPELPQGWCWATLESIASVTGGLAKSGSRVANAPMREVPYLRVANVQRGYLDLSEIKTILATEKDIADLRLVPGDVLFNEGGDRDKLGRGHVWNGEVPEAIHQNHVFRARASQDHVLPQYLSMCGNGYGVDWFSEYATQSVNLASISLSTLRKFPVALPPLAEQHRIVAEADRRLSLIRVAEAQVAANLARAQRLRQSILQAAFSP